MPFNNMKIVNVRRNPFPGTKESYIGILDNNERVIWKPHPWKWRYEVAAYEVDQIIGFNLVPFTFRTEFEGRVGSAQLFIKGIEKQVIGLRDRKTGLFKYYCKNAKQSEMEIQSLFDFVIHNSDRSMHSNWILTSDGRVASIDHDKAFQGFEDRKCRLCKKEIVERDPFSNEIECPHCLSKNTLEKVEEKFLSLERLRIPAMEYVRNHPNSIFIKKFKDPVIQQELLTKLSSLITPNQSAMVLERIRSLVPMENQ